MTCAQELFNSQGPISLSLSLSPLLVRPSISSRRLFPVAQSTHVRSREAELRRAPRRQRLLHLKLAEREEQLAKARADLFPKEEELARTRAHLLETREQLTGARARPPGAAVPGAGGGGGGC
ncbi:hypothetical protein GQ55_2G039600 [Panicum hallii var. hallii]|uniref:Uncharacterized protein n=1 Tax=Panicum hallii var. hallii TaxID=1504633 RepID=A0A2T7EL75_9POAL|nr:hypothetical protein GQ55_2G039600 [Panicum hallii var. hallii]